MPDNGFGNKANSFDFELRAYYITPDFKTANGGTGAVAIGLDDYVAFRDPNHQAGFPIVHENTTDRLLTGADFDPESIQRGPNGDLWLGDEFGPWILHFGADGVLLEPPIAMPDGLMSPANPHLDRAVDRQRQPWPRGNGDQPERQVADLHPRRCRASVLPTRSRAGSTSTTSPAAAFTRLADYRTEVAGHFVSDVQALDNHRLVVIERDGGRGLAANFRKVYEVDLNRDRRRRRSRQDTGRRPGGDPRSGPRLAAGDPHRRRRARRPVPGDVRVDRSGARHLPLAAAARLRQQLPEHRPEPGNRADDSEFIVVKVPGL